MCSTPNGAARACSSPPGKQRQAHRVGRPTTICGCSRPPGSPREPLPNPGAGGVYAWWGRDYALAPNGRLLAYSAPDGVGLLDLASGERRILASFAPARSFGDLVWTPGLTWKPDGSALAAVVHRAPSAGEAPEDSTAFDLWVFPVNATAGTRLAANVGMWAVPSWSPDGRFLAYGVSRETSATAATGYDLWIMDVERDASRLLLSGLTWGGSLPQRAVWSPQSNELVVTYRSDLYLVSLSGDPPRALTDDGRSSNAIWR